MIAFNTHLLTRQLLLASLSAAAITIAVDSTSALAQEEEVRLRPADPIQSDVFGYDVAFDGTTIVGGAPFGTYLGLPLGGRAYAFSHDGTTWMQDQLLLPSIRQEKAFFGVTVTVDGNAMAVAAPSEDTHAQDAGAVYIYERTGGTWNEVAHLSPASLTAGARFGTALSMQGNVLLVGASADDYAGHIFAGAVYVFERIDGNWKLMDTLHADDPAIDDNFGETVALDGDTAIIGAIDADHSGETDPGAAYIFQKVGGAWNQTDKLIASDPREAALCGGAVAIQGDTAVIGAMNVNRVYVFERSNGVWSEVNKWSSTSAYGVDVDIDANNIIIGAYVQPAGGGTGMTYVYRKSGGSWAFHTRLIASDLQNTLYGWRLALSGDRAVIGGPFFNVNQGAVYVVKGMSGCYADCDQSTGAGVLDVFDFLCFQDSFVSSQGYACECDVSTGNGVCDTFDFLCFQDSFVNGCP